MQSPMMDGDHDPGESTHSDDPRSRLQEFQQRKKANVAFAELVEVIAMARRVMPMGLISTVEIH